MYRIELSPSERGQLQNLQQIIFNGDNDGVHPLNIDPVRAGAFIGLLQQQLLS